MMMKAMKELCSAKATSSDSSSAETELVVSFKSRAAHKLCKPLAILTGNTKNPRGKHLSSWEYLKKCGMNTNFFDYQTNKHNIINIHMNIYIYTRYIFDYYRNMVDE